MEQSFSHGLLYSVAPENISELHLQDETNTYDEFEWEKQGSAISSLILAALAFLKNPAAK
jgi:hypothetical protein